MVVKPAWGLRIIALASGAPCKFAGHWVRAFDPDVMEPGKPDRTGQLITTPVPQLALRFLDRITPFAFWRQRSVVVPLRPDGQPNRPLTAFTVEIEQLPA